MATKAKDVTELVFYDCEDIRRICHVGRAKAYEIMAKINKEKEAAGKMVIAGRVRAEYLKEYF